MIFLCRLHRAALREGIGQRAADMPNWRRENSNAEKDWTAYQASLAHSHSASFRIAKAAHPSRNKKWKYLHKIEVQVLTSVIWFYFKDAWLLTETWHFELLTWQKYVHPSFHLWKRPQKWIWSLYQYYLIRQFWHHFGGIACGPREIIL